MFAGRITGGRGGVFPGDRSKGTVIGGVDLIQDLVGRVDDVRPERKVLGECEFHFEFRAEEVEEDVRSITRAGLRCQDSFVWWMVLWTGFSGGFIYAGGYPNLPMLYIIRSGRSASQGAAAATWR